MKICGRKQVITALYVLKFGFFDKKQDIIKDVYFLAIQNFFNNCVPSLKNCALLRVPEAKVKEKNP